MKCESPSVVYILPDALGGVATLIGNLLRYRRPDDLRYHVVLTRDLRQRGERPIPDRLSVDCQSAVVFERSIDNLEKVLRDVRRSIPAGEGIVVANEWLGLAALSESDCGRTVLHILHGDMDFCYELAIRHEPVIDGFVTHTRLIYEKLRRFLPHRWDRIFYLPYGVAIPSERRAAANGPIRLLFVARLVQDKGICELPAIDEALLARDVQARWTIVGSGPDGDRVKAEWQNPRVRWTGVLSNVDVLSLYSEHDVLVLPTRMEGFPVSMLEAMAAGVVPVVTDLPGGIQQAVQHAVTGYLHRFWDVDGFAESIARLDNDRARLETMSVAAHQLVRDEFDIRKRVTAYQDLFARWRELRRTDRGRLPVPYGNRLDKKWLPNCLVRTLRRIIRGTIVPAISSSGGGHGAGSDAVPQRS